MSDDDIMDVAYGQRARGGFLTNWTAIGVIGSFLFSAVAVIAYGVNMNANIASNHAIETEQLKAQETQIAQLQGDQKDNNKQMVEVLLQLQSINQTLKDRLPPQTIPSPETPSRGSNRN